MAIISINSSRFGKIEIDESMVLHMPAGILGFPKSDRYILLDHEPDSPFKWLHSIEEPDVAFVVADPIAFFPDYDIMIKKEELATLDIEKVDDLQIMVILSIGGDLKEMTANLQGPVIVNTINRKGRQVVLKGSKYFTKHKLFTDTPSESLKA